MKKYRLFFLCFLFLVSCSSQSFEDYRDEGRGVTRNLIKELQKIRTKDQLRASSTKLKKLFNQTADIMIAAQEHAQKYPLQEIPELTKIDHDLSDSLRSELNRIYTIEGGRNLIEKCQEEALNKLDAYEKKKRQRVKRKDEGERMKEQ